MRKILLALVAIVSSSAAALTMASPAGAITGDRPRLRPSTAWPAETPARSIATPARKSATSQATSTCSRVGAAGS